jgi:L-rhamnose-H+ transport protein
METHLGLGIGLVLLGGLLNGSFAAPMKRLPAWRWENTWLIFSLVATIVLPWAMALATVPNLGAIYQQTAWPVLLRVGLFGLGWGIGSTLFGLGITRVGMALGFAIILGITASMGSLFPLIVLHSEQLFSRAGYALMVGIVLVVVGIVFCSLAGRQREREIARAKNNPSRSGFGVGLVICIFSGIFSPMINFSFLFGGDLQQSSLAAGASPSMASNAVWSLALTGGLLPNAAYCLYLLQKNRTWPLYRAPAAGAGYWFGASLMGLVWFGGLVVYGMGATVLGPLGGIVGWPVFMAINITVANVWGALSGEWKGASRRSYAYSLVGIAILFVAIAVIGAGGSG